MTPTYFKMSVEDSFR